MIAILVFSSLVAFVPVAVLGSFWLAPGRYQVSVDALVGGLVGVLNIGGVTYKFLFSALLGCILGFNVLSNLPFSSSPTLIYFFSARLALTFWVGVILVVLYTQPYEFVAHMIPAGAPVYLSILLPVIEVFSQIIRPFTLLVRLSTNLSAGHIMLYMFSLFSISSYGLALPIVFLVGFLFALEIMVAALQAYIFAALSYLYLSERL